MAKMVKIQDNGISQDFSINNHLVDSLLKAFGYYLQRQEKDRDEIKRILDGVQVDAMNLANEGQKRFHVTIKEV